MDMDTMDSIVEPTKEPEPEVPERPHEESPRISNNIAMEPAKVLESEAMNGESKSSDLESPLICNDIGMEPEAMDGEPKSNSKSPPEAPEPENEQLIYNKSAAYWANIEPTVDGMLGGLGKLSGIDIQSSERFLKTVQQLNLSTSTHRALECGAGIGRITANLLTRHFDMIDIVEQNPKFVEQAKVELGKLNNRKGTVENFYCVGLQDFEFENDYDLIWVQWVLNYLNDEDLLRFFIKCRSHLTPNGLLIVKENCTRPTSKGPIPDDDDSSITRPTTHFLRTFEEAGFRLLGKEKQKRFPKELFPVWTFGLVPKKC